jgi:hypothetical protein
VAGAPAVASAVDGGSRRYAQGCGVRNRKDDSTSWRGRAARGRVGGGVPQSRRFHVSKRHIAARPSGASCSGSAGPNAKSRPIHYSGRVIRWEWIVKTCNRA